VAEYARPALTVDVALIAATPAPSVLLVARAHEPYAGAWALPGGFVEQDERIVEAAARELAEETGVSAGELTLLGVYDTPGRDPRGWTVSVTYHGSVEQRLQARGGDDASEAAWFALDALPPLAFDHAQIVADAAAAVASGR
jgi:8-oxo-dGTP diphosphatase